MHIHASSLFLPIIQFCWYSNLLSLFFIFLGFFPYETSYSIKIIRVILLYTYMSKKSCA